MSSELTGGEHFARAASLLSAMSNSVRLKLLTRLQQGETSVGSLADEMKISQSALSQHLAKLRARGVVSTTRDGQTIYYTCNSPAVAAVLSALDRI